jgi:hypothetical protein
MDVAYILALSALAGSVVGGFTSRLITWAHRAQARVERLRFDLSRGRSFSLLSSRLRNCMRTPW